MTTEGTDISRYDSTSPADTSAVDEQRAQFVILNIEDPGCANKAHRAHEIGKLWALYSWLYPGRGAESAHRLQAMVDLLVLDGLPVPPKGGFLDFEENGVSAADLTAGRLAAATLPTPIGPYTYLYLLRSEPGLFEEWWKWSGRWIAYYPGANDGSYPADQIGDAEAWGAMLWQFSSSNGTRDRDVVVDETEWAAWGTPGQTVPAPIDWDGILKIARRRRDNMAVVQDSRGIYLLTGGKLLPFADADDASDFIRHLGQGGAIEVSDGQIDVWKAA